MIKFCYTHQSGWDWNFHDEQKKLLDIRCTENYQDFFDVLTENMKVVTDRKRELKDQLEWVEEILESYHKVDKYLHELRYWR